MLPAVSYTVVGVVRDLPGFCLADWPLAAVYLPTSSGSRTPRSRSACTATLRQRARRCSTGLRCSIPR